jgi:hypothetical protein
VDGKREAEEEGEVYYRVGDATNASFGFFNGTGGEDTPMVSEAC